jgi:uncharacterized protein (UPF0147 family)
MKYLLSRERLRRQNFKEIEPKYIALKSIIHNQTLPNNLRWEASLLLSKIIKKNSRSSFKNRLNDYIICEELPTRFFNER